MSQKRFTAWIEAQGGATQLAARLNIETNTVHNWLYGKTTPKALVMQALVKMGNEAFSYDDIINETKKQKRGKS